MNQQLPIDQKKQSGLVMLMVMSVVVLMIILLALLLEDQHRMIRQVANQKVTEQGYQFTQGLNAWAIRVLHEDKNPLIDHEDEKWAKFGRAEERAEGEIDSFSLDSSTLRSQEEETESATNDFGIDSVEVNIDDLQGRYNLNNLVSDKKNTSPPPDQRRIFLNLLQILEIGEFQEDRDQLYWNLVDWLDENDTSAAFGAESGYYRVRSKPYFSSDQALSSLGELRYVKGFSKKVINKLRPYVSALPVKNARLNLNTVSAEVLASLAGGPVANPSQVDVFLARKKQPGFNGFNKGDITVAESVVNLVSPGHGFVRNMLQVNSEFFQINTKVELGNQQVCARTAVLRPRPRKPTNVKSKTTISVISREQDTICREHNESSTEQETTSDEILS